jgi:hypothetical protein
MTDSIASCLAGLLAAGDAQILDWDPSALADWPNIVPSDSAATLPAGPPAAGFDQPR